MKPQLESAGILPLLLLIARPAAGKSEIIDYLAGIEAEERRRRFHLGGLEVLDDFPLLWEWFEEDGVLSQLGHPRLHTSEEGAFKQTYLWDVLIRRLCLGYRKLLAADPTLHERRTVILEFSRGSEHGGYVRAFSQLAEEVLSRAAVLYVRVSYAESRRKNRRRFNPDRPYSILEHSLPEENMERLYREDDWEQLSGADPHYLEVQGCRLPHTVLENEDDVTTRGGEALGRRLEEALGRLWEIVQARR